MSDRQTIPIESPDGTVKGDVLVDETGRLSYRLVRGDVVILDSSPMGVTVDGVDLGKGIELGEPQRETVNESYAWRGVKPQAVNHYNGVTVPVTHSQSGLNWALEVRAYNDGFAYRYIIPGEGERTVNAEATAWRLPPGSEIWYQTVTLNYEGIHEKRLTEKARKRKYLGFPVTVELPGEGGYAAITEGALYDYGGMVLQPTGSTLLQGVFDDDLKGWRTNGTIKSPWRITMTGPDLNTLVNCDIVHNVCPPPDETLFPEGMFTDWIRPGRALWNWWSDSSVEFRFQKNWIDKAAEFGFEHYLVDVGWEKAWQSPGKDKWAHLKELTDYAAEKGIGIFVWKRWADGSFEGSPLAGIETVSKRLGFFEHCREAGVAGVKIDFMDSESKDRIGFYEATLRDAAKFELMVNFHGANKPAGEPRTWPNEVTREGVRGLEYNKWSTLPPHHYASLPFTRYLAGHGDFTPCTFDPDKIKGTTFTQQLATAVVYTSPLMHWADTPERYQQSPAFEVMKSIPSTWDETLVLPGSSIGELAAFARRNGSAWFVGILNGGAKRSYELELFFLDDGEYGATFVRDRMDSPTAMAVETGTAKRGQTVSVEISDGGGFVARFMKGVAIK
jgi:alpha-glucosidase